MEAEMQTPPDTVAVRKALLRQRTALDAMRNDETIPASPFGGDAGGNATFYESPIKKLVSTKGSLGAWQDLVLYKEPAHSWLIILAGSMTLATVHFALNGNHNITLLSAICYIMLGELALNFLRSIFSTRPEAAGVWQGTSLVAAMVQATTSAANYAASLHDQYLVVKNPAMALKVGGMLWGFAVVGRYVSAWTLAASIFAGAFSLPYLYQTHHDTVHAIYGQLSDAVTQRWASLGLSRKQQAVGLLSVLAFAWVRSSWPTRFIGLFIGALALRCNLKPTEMAAIRQRAAPLTHTVKKRAARMSMAASDFFARPPQGRS